MRIVHDRVENKFIECIFVPFLFQYKNEMSLDIGSEFVCLDLGIILSPRTKRVLSWTY